MNNKERAAVFAKYCQDNFNLQHIYDDEVLPLSLCLLETVFSLRAKEESTKKVRRRYADTYLNGTQANVKDTLSDFVTRIENAGGALDFAENILKNRQKLNGSLKADICCQLANQLLSFGIETTEDFKQSFEKKQIDKALLSVHGFGQQGLNYLHMAIGEEDYVKADVYINKCIKQALGTTLNNEETQQLFKDTVEILKQINPELTARKLDLIIWMKYKYPNA